jgi:hypothetical protein
MSDKDPLPKAMQPYADAVQRVAQLLDGPHPGLMTWLGFLMDRSRRLYIEMVKAGFEDDPEVDKALKALAKEYKP